MSLPSPTAHDLPEGVFIVQESVHADHISRYATRDEALSAIDEMIREGESTPGDFSIREIDDRGRTIRVFSLDQAPALMPRELQILRLVATASLTNRWQPSSESRERLSAHTCEAHSRSSTRRRERKQ